MGTRTRTALAATAACLVLAAVAALAWWSWSAPAGPAPAAPVALAAPAPASPPPPPPTTTPAAPVPVVDAQEVRPAAAPPSRSVTRPSVPPDAPATVRIGAIGVDAPVVAVGVDGAGAMEVPQDVATTGWYRFGPAPGDRAGSAVISGHVDDRVQGRGAFYSLGDLSAGDPVEVEKGDGSLLRYRVTAVERIEKAVLPVDRIFTRGGPPRLMLITCGGEFDRATRNYLSNIVVTAEPVG